MSSVASYYFNLSHELRWRLAPLWSPRSVHRLRQEQRQPQGRFHPYRRRGAIFVHIPKCAGTSVAQAVFGQRKFAHRSVRDYQRMFSPAEFSAFYKFTVVRNPWDRLVSAWNFLRSERCPPGDQSWVKRHLMPYETFEHFVHDGLKRYPIRDFYMFRSQSSYLCLPGQDALLVDKICHFETLIDDLDGVFQALGAPAVPLRHLNVSRHADYRSYYSADSWDAVARTYLRDISILGYRDAGWAPSASGSQRWAATFEAPRALRSSGT